MSIVDRIQAMLETQGQLPGSLQDTLELRNRLLHQGLIQHKTYNLPLTDVTALPPLMPARTVATTQADTKRPLSYPG